MAHEILTAHVIDLEAPCIDGAGERTRLGYVRLWNGGNRVLAHVDAWQKANGQVPDGMELDHLCRHRWCRNEKHLEPVTHRVNSQRAGNRKLDQMLAAEIRSMYVPRIVTQCHIAALYGVSRRTVQQVLSGNFYP